MEPLVANQESGLLLRDGIRYVAIRPDVLMNAVRNLSNSSRSEFLGALAASAEKYGGRSIEHYSNKTRGRGAMLLNRVASSAAALGWGKWQFGYERTSAKTVTAVTLTVLDSPFAIGHGSATAPMCAAVVGILRSAIAQAYGAIAIVSEVQCSSQGHDTCLFEAIISSDARS